MSTNRTAEVVRNTGETQIRVAINMDGTGQQKLATGVPFLDHMLDQIARHGLIDLDIEAKGDLHIDAHHTVEDVGITLGQAFAKAKEALRHAVSICLQKGETSLADTDSQFILEAVMDGSLAINVGFTSTAPEKAEVITASIVAYFKSKRF